MPASMDCVLCLLRQSLEAARFVSSDPKIHQQVLQTAIEKVLQFGLNAPPPRIGQEIHRVIREITHSPDPYANEKRRFNEMMFQRYSLLKKQIENANDPLEMGIRLAIAGNSIDFALGGLNHDYVDRSFAEALTRPLNGSLEEFRRLLETSQTIFYLSDNTGEIVCDRLLIELLMSAPYKKKITLGVRGKPVINDATRDDAEFVGLDKLVPILDNGNDGLGILIDQCGPEFLQKFQEVDFVLAKGLANYETLVDNPSTIQPKKIVHLFKAKCPFISDYASSKLGDLVIRIH